MNLFAEIDNINMVLKLRRSDLVKRAVVNTGSTDVGVVSMEIWRLLAKLCFGIEPGALTRRNCDALDILLTDYYGIYSLQDVREIIGVLKDVP
jgi:hypothetical protein